MSSEASSDQDTKTATRAVRLSVFANWPLVWRLPLAMAAIVLVFAVVLTTLGLRELEQREFVARTEVGAAFLDTLAGVVEPALSSGATRPAIEALLAASAQFKASLRNEAVVVCCLPDGSLVLTSSYPSNDDAQTFNGATEIALSAFIEDNAALPVGEAAVRTIEETAKLLILQSYPMGEGGVMQLGAAFDLEWQRAEQVQRRRTALTLDVIVTILAALLTFVIARASLKPIDELTQALDQDTYDPERLSGSFGADTEMGRLHKALKSRAEIQAKADALAKAESKHAREATLARLAAGLAHEVRNPVAGMSAAASTLRRYGDDKTVREQTVDLIERGLQSIDHVAASMLSTYRQPEGNRDLEPSDLDDLQTLVNPKARVKQVVLEFNNLLAQPFPTSAEAVRQIAINLLLNAIDATPNGSNVTFEARATDDHLAIAVGDSGSGLPDEALSVLTDGGKTTKPQTRRLGLWLVHQLIDDVNGRIAIATRSDHGTLITITIPKRAE